MKKLTELLEALERLPELEDSYQRMKYEMDFYVQEKPSEEFIRMVDGGSTVVLPSVRISTKKVIEAILEHLDLRMDYTTGRFPDVILRRNDEDRDI